MAKKSGGEECWRKVVKVGGGGVGAGEWWKRVVEVRAEVCW